MAKSRPRKKAKPTQPQLPGMPPPLPPGIIRIFPAHFQIGDRIADETGEWEVAGHPFTTVGGKNANVRVQLIKQPLVTEIRVWGAHEKLSVRRASAEEGKR